MEAAHSGGSPVEDKAHFAGIWEEDEDVGDFYVRINCYEPDSLLVCCPESIKASVCNPSTCGFYGPPKQMQRTETYATRGTFLCCLAILV